MDSVAYRRELWEAETDADLERVEGRGDGCGFGEEGRFVAE